MRVNVATLYAYPDVTVVCDPPDFADDTFDTLLNPVLLIEVLSPSTEGFDRGAKFQLYREIDSLQEYLLVSQSSPRIEHYSKQNSGMWLLTDVVGMDGALDLASIAAQLALQDVYAKVSFEAKD
jgi:Uma2 family endonuclease